MDFQKPLLDHLFSEANHGFSTSMLVCPSNEQTWTDNKDPDRFPKNKMIDNYMESLRFFFAFGQS